MWNKISSLLKGKKASIFSASGLLLMYLNQCGRIGSNEMLLIQGVLAAFGVSINVGDAITRKKGDK